MMSETSPNPATPESTASFSMLGLREELNAALDALGYESPTPIQQQTIPALMEGRDLVGRAQTGSGKTAAFSLPILHRLEEGRSGIQALILTPTRELALQVAEAIAGYAQRMRWVRVAAVYGGAPYPPQLRALSAGVQVLVATPGRLLDHMERGSVRLEGVSTFVLDEADQMLKMGFIEDVERILEAIPDGSLRALFSATMPPPISRIADRTLRDPVQVRIAASEDNVPQIEQRMLRVRDDEKLEILAGLLETQDIDAAIIFARTQARVAEVADALSMMGHAAEALHGGMNQTMRERVVARLRDGSVRLVVATDVAARGIDVDRVTHVINFDIPHDAESYVHRIGRTGRAGRSGVSYLFVTWPERRQLSFIERLIRQRIEVVEPPTAVEVADARATSFQAALSAEIERGGLEHLQGLITGWATELEVAPELLAAAAVRMATRERSLEPAPERPRRRAAPASREREPSFASEGRSYDRQDGPRGRAPRPGAGDNGPPVDRSEEGMVTLQLAAGRRDGVRPQVVVAAIATAASIPGSAIGRIDISDAMTFVDVRQECADDVLALSRLSLGGRNVTAQPAGARPRSRVASRGPGRPERTPYRKGPRRG